MHARNLRGPRLELFFLLVAVLAVSCREDPYRRPTLSEENDARFSIARDHYFRGRFTKAAELFADVARLSAEESGTPYTLALNYEGLCYQYLGEYEKARERYLEALSFQHYDDGIVDSLNNLGWLAYLEGDLREADRYLARASEMSEPLVGKREKRGADTLIRGIWINRGIVLKELGKIGQARAYLERALLESSVDHHGMNDSRLFSTLGDLERETGSREKAENYERALGAAEVDSRHPYNRSYLVESMLRLAAFLQESDEPARARVWLERALENARGLESPWLTAQVQAALGNYLRSQGDPEGAKRYHHEAASLLEESTPTRAAAEVRLELAFDELEAGNFRSAAVMFEALREKEGDAVRGALSRRLLEGLGRALAGAGDRKRAIGVYAELAALLGRIDVRYLLAERRFAYWGSQHRVFAELSRLHFAEGDSLKAFLVAERGRSRTLHNLRRERGEGLSEGEALLMARRSRLEEWINGFHSREQTRRLEAELRRITRQLEASEPAQVGGIELEEIQRRLEDRDEILVSFLLGQREGLAWMITGDRFAAYPVPGAVKLERTIGSLIGSIGRPAVGQEAVEQTLKQSGDLFEELFGPVREILREVDSVVIIPDGVLHELPFESLLHTPPLDGVAAFEHFLGSKRITYSPSVRLWRSAVARGESSLKEARALLIAPVPASGSAGSLEPADLPFALEEIAFLKNLWSRVEVVSHPTREGLLEERLAPFGIIHFAGHARTDRQAKDPSGLVLGAQGSDEFLSIGDVARLRLEAELVTLAACETAAGKVYPGEGVLGLSSAFLQAGARQLLLSLWEVDDEATMKYMRSFYQTLASGESIAESARSARKKFFVSSVPAYRFPYFWAAFIHIVG